MLLGNFYRILTVEKVEVNVWKLSINFNPHHPVYKEHFPNEPFIPGVCLMQIIRECVSDVLGKPMHYQSVSGCKFLLNVDPEQIPVLDFVLSLHKKEDNHYQLTAEGFAGDKPVIKLRGALK